MTKLLQIHPSDTVVSVGDIVKFSDYNLEWRVVKVLHEYGTVWLRSVIGNRFGVENISRVKIIIRDPDYQQPIDWTEFYDDTDE
jgi:hypothetical protein